MAFASFGIITPVLSVVISVFMLGLSVGAWMGGRLIAGLVGKTGLSAILFYAFAELLIGFGAFAVPKLFAIGEHFLLAAGQTDSVGYLFFSALVLAASILPWCVCLGATFPLMMAYIREREYQNSTSFSYLYLANVLGAMCGTILTALVLIELLGFRRTLWVAAAFNFTIALISCSLGFGRRGIANVLLVKAETPLGTPALSPHHASRGRAIKWILFSTGFSAMAMEVVWSRAFTPVLKTQVYSFALVVFAYLGATFLGSLGYRRDLRNHSPLSTATLVFWLATTAFLPVLVNDPRFVRMNWMGATDLTSAIIVLASICPLCAILGYLTPSLIDEYAAGRPADAGKVYALNVLGCILGPLFASYVLLPRVSERHALILLCLPLLAFGFFYYKSLPRWARLSSGSIAGVTMTWALFFSQDFEGRMVRFEKNTTVRRDYAASVISFGEMRNKHLLVNGIGMTALTPVTKFMVHLPLAFHKGQPKSALLICFGMGTGYRSALSWDIETTAVELVPSVKEAFAFYHADAAQFINNSKGRIIIDDGRRYLKRTQEKFDVIVIDPPPPVEAAGSSLLYSQEFYALARQHLKPNGILQAWFPGGELATAHAVLRSLHDSFPYVRCFDSVEGWGMHLLASAEPIEIRSAGQLAAQMPASAKQDLLEWSSSQNPAAYLERVLVQEAPIDNVLNPNPEIRITDDQPYNEYFLLRQFWR